MSYLTNDKRSQNEWITVNNLDQILADVQFSRDTNRDFIDLKGSPYSPLEITLTPLIHANKLTRYSCQIKPLILIIFLTESLKMN